VLLAAYQGRGGLGEDSKDVWIDRAGINEKSGRSNREERGSNEKAHQGWGSKGKRKVLMARLCSQSEDGREEEWGRDLQKPADMKDKKAMKCCNSGRTDE